MSFALRRFATAGYASRKTGAAPQADGMLLVGVTIGYRIMFLTAATVNYKSYPIQDEPEGELRFQHKMSLERMAC